jgi:hypothetical protein
MKPRVGSLALVLVVGALTANCAHPRVEVVKVKPTEAEKLRKQIALYESENMRGITYRVLEPLEATSCRLTGDFWYPAASEQDATDQLRFKAAELGANGLLNMSCGRKYRSSYTKSCFEAIACNAAAIRVGAEAEGPLGVRKRRAARVDRSRPIYSGSLRTTPDEPLGMAGLKPTLEDKDAGLVGIAPEFDLESYRVVLVDRVSVTDPTVKDEADRWVATDVATSYQAELVRLLRASGLFTRVVNIAETEYQPDHEKALKLEARITRLGEGSGEGRPFGGFGFRPTRAQAEIGFVDVQSGQPVLVTADRRIGPIAAPDLTSRDELKESFDDMAADLVTFLWRLSKGEGPTKE